MGKISPENYTKPQLLDALAKAGVTGVSRARKDELVEMCAKLRGKARVVLVKELEASPSKAAVADAKPAIAALAKKPQAAVKKPAQKKAAATKAAAEAKRKERLEKPPAAIARADEEQPEPVRDFQPTVPQAPPLPGDFPLPESYGIDMFHVLVFDPYGAYVFWELSPALLGQLYSSFGEEKWQSRKLMVRAASASGKLATQELYGERGSYFMNVQEPGQSVSFELGFMIWNSFHPVSPVRTIAFPRDRASEEKSVKLLEVKQAEASLSLRELADEEALKLTLEPLGGDYRSEHEEGPLPSSAENIRPGGGK